VESFSGTYLPGETAGRIDRMQVLEIRFRVPEGEEFCEDRMDSFSDLEITEEDVRSEDEGFVLIRLRLDDELDETDIECAVEEFAEAIMDAAGDMDLLDFDHIEVDE